MTASTSRSDRAALLAAGADACLTKPLSADILAEALTAVRAPADGDGAAPATLDDAVMEHLRSGQAPGSPAVFDQLIDLFLDDTPSQLRRLRRAAILGDAGDLELVAHRLRGSSASIGATRMMTLASEVESRAERGDIAAAAGATEDLEGAWLATRSALEHARRALR